jgi:hypothetical protein
MYKHMQHETKKLRTATLQEQLRVRILKKEVLKRIFRPKREGIT